KVRGARVRMRIPDAHELFAAAVNEERHGAVGLIFDDAEIFALSIDRPLLNRRKAVFCGVAHRILNYGVVPDAHAGVAPPVEALADVVAIAEADVLFEDGR